MTSSFDHVRLFTSRFLPWTKDAARVLPMFRKRTRRCRHAHSRTATMTKKVGTREQSLFEHRTNAASQITSQGEHTANKRGIGQTDNTGVDERRCNRGRAG